MSNYTDLVQDLLLVYGQDQEASRVHVLWYFRLDAHNTGNRKMLISSPTTVDTITFHMFLILLFLSLKFFVLG
ncbi:MAG TPA: hypothetical protein VJV40_10090 [Thermodesulfobacteriota bacterium]|nr:hypothetical protein [Thermodesulfobacteriota bacterium]